MVHNCLTLTVSSIQTFNKTLFFTQLTLHKGYIFAHCTSDCQDQYINECTSWKHSFLVFQLLTAIYGIIFYVQYCTFNILSSIPMSKLCFFLHTTHLLPRNCCQILTNFYWILIYKALLKVSIGDICQTLRKGMKWSTLMIRATFTQLKLEAPPL